MAQPILCDVHNLTHYADVLVTQLGNGDTMAACGEGYVDMCRAIVASSGPSEADLADADALARLEGTTANTAFPSSPDSSDAGDPPAGSPGNDGDDPGSLQSAPGPARSTTNPDEPFPGVTDDPEGVAG